MMLAAFKAYDVRGRIPDELNESRAWHIGYATVQRFHMQNVVVGRDMRLSSPALSEALMNGIRDAGANVIDIGMCGTEMVYFATFHLENEGVDGGIMVTASHNPADYNGMKFVQRGARPISGDTGLKDIERLVMAQEAQAPLATARRGSHAHRNILDAYVTHMLSFIDVAALAPLHVVSNPGNGCAGLAVDALAARLPQLTFTRIQHEPDGHFPHGIPNPLLVENRATTSRVMHETGADVGLAWDGDFDRCFFFDHLGNFIEGYYIVGLLAEQMLTRARAAGEPHAAILHDPRLEWATLDTVRDHGGRAVRSKTGHAFIKERMRAENAIYGGEMSAHHYFRDFAFCDSGMIPWLLVCERIATSKKSLHELVAEKQRLFPASGEINLHLKNAKSAVQGLRLRYDADAESIDTTDGVSMDFGTWRMNVRSSNTEPVLRVNVETRADVLLLHQKTEEVLSLLRSCGEAL
jgi:phosphomannomutase